MLAHGKMLSEFWGLPSLLRAASRRRPKKVAQSLPSAKRANYFLPLSNHIFFRYSLLHFLFIRLDAQLAG